MAETIVRLCPRTTVLATSREPLRTEGECVYRVPPLEVPPEHSIDRSDVLRHSAVALFIARMRALDSDFPPTGDYLSAIAAICRRLDGIPLAIEFAAALAAILGLSRLAELLDDRFRALTRGRSTALPRHQTLRAALDWSYELLAEAERLLLRRLAVFSAGFTLDAAVAVMSDAGLDDISVADGITNLVAKSLIMVGKPERAPRWYLLETVRAYAFEELEKTCEAEQTARRHAEYFCDLLTASAENGAPVVHARTDIAFEIENIRGALVWAFGAKGAR